MIKDILYNEIFLEASKGRIDCGFIYNVIFRTITPTKNYSIEGDFPNLQIPTLYISNKEDFDSLIESYVDIAFTFYDKDYYDNEHEYIKAIMTFLFVNMTAEEFLNPCEYIKRRISFIKNSLALEIDSPVFFGNSSYIGNISVTLNKEPIYEETPYSLNFKTEDSIFPAVRFGIDSNSVYIYAIQNRKDASIDKKTNRILYKINENFDTTNESYDNINDYENLTGVTNSAVVAATMALSFFLKMGYTDIRMPSFLPVRFNAKELTREKKMSKFIHEENFDNLNQDSFDINMSIQRNISDKFIRTFRRIENHFDNININSFPFDVDSYLHLTMNDRVYCNNPLLEDIFLCGYEQTKTK